MTPSLSKEKIWVDGCFDFAHHGHAGAMRQAKCLGKELFVGVHSDEEILLNKGPVVMRLAERVLAVEACKWSNKVVVASPYVTDPAVMDSYGCQYVVHGDDITSDANGEDCYQVVKDTGRFLVVKRTEGISTTDLVGRMLLYTKTHHVPSLQAGVSGILDSPAVLAQFEAYASGADGTSAGSLVTFYTNNALSQKVEPSPETRALLAGGVFYTDGAFDLFHPGHIEALRLIHEQARAEGGAVVVGIQDDRTVNANRGVNYPIMNIIERALCVLQCAYVDAIVLGAPAVVDAAYLEALGGLGPVKAFFHGPTSEAIVVGDQLVDPYRVVRNLGLFRKLPPHQYSDITTESIVERVLTNRVAYETRQRQKGWKGEVERRLQEQESKVGA